MSTLKMGEEFTSNPRLPDQGEDLQKLHAAIKDLRGCLGHLTGESVFLEEPNYLTARDLRTHDGIPVLGFLYAKSLFPIVSTPEDFVRLYHHYFSESKGELSDTDLQKRLESIAGVIRLVVLQRQYISPRS